MNLTGGEILNIVFGSIAVLAVFIAVVLVLYALIGIIVLAFKDE